MKFYHTATQEDYDALMVELDGQGYKWFRGQKMQDFDGFEKYEEKTVIRIDDSKNAMFEYYDREKDVLEYKAKGEKMDEKQFKQQSHELVVNIASTLGTFTRNLELTDDDLAKTQKLVKKFDDTLTEFIDSRKPEFNIRDYIVREYSDETYIGEVNDIKENHAVCCSYETVNNVICLDEIFNLDNIRHATQEEIAEYEAALSFNKHGRKLFEVKEGDLIKSRSGTKTIVSYPSAFSKMGFVNGTWKLLKTAEEVNEWLADGQ